MKCYCDYVYYDEQMKIFTHNITYKIGIGSFIKTVLVTVNLAMK